MKPQTWFRLYNEVVDDPKVQQLTPRLFKNWINFMCLVSKGGGALPPWSDVAYRLRTTEAKAREWLHELIAANLFEVDEKDGSVYSHNWEHRQFRSDVSTDRVRTFRERQRNASGNVSETPDETPATDTDTKQKHNRTERAPSGTFAYSDEFEDFWKLYPRKDGKGAAYRAWQKLHPPNELQEKIREAVSRAKTTEQWHKDNGQFIPHASTWLNERRFDDEGGVTPPEPIKPSKISVHKYL